MAQGLHLELLSAHKFPSIDGITCMCAVLMWGKTHMVFQSKKKQTPSGIPLLEHIHGVSKRLDSIVAETIHVQHVTKIQPNPKLRG